MTVQTTLGEAGEKMDKAISVLKEELGSTSGSALYTPSTFVPFRMASAPISNARWAAVVSVEKKGAPIPAAKITIRPFSRCRIARRRM